MKYHYLQMAKDSYEAAYIVESMDPIWPKKTSELAFVKTDHWKFLWEGLNSFENPLVIPKVAWIGYSIFLQFHSNPKLIDLLCLELKISGDAKEVYLINVSTVSKGDWAEMTKVFTTQRLFSTEVICRRYWCSRQEQANRIEGAKSGPIRVSCRHKRQRLDLAQGYAL